MTSLSNPKGDFTMRIDIQANGFELTEALRQYAERHLHFALSWAGNDVRKIVVRLSDVNGPRGGKDKRCSIQIPMPRAQDVLIEDTESDMYVAIDRAVDRAERTLARKLERLHEYRHQRPVADDSFSADGDKVAARASLLH
jgi:putative sigma-54 modulation protein